MKWVHVVSFSLVVVGAVNWGLVGLINVNLVELILGAWPGLVRVVYVLVGVSGVYLAATHFSDCKVCAK